MNSHIENFVEVINIGELKGWIEIAPGYNTYKPAKKEKISTNEAVHIWDHIN